MEESPSATSTVTRVRWAKRATTTVAAVAVTACVLFGLFAHHADVFQHDAPRVLRRLQEARAISVALTPREDSAAFASGISDIHGVLFPRLSAGSGDSLVPFDGRVTYEQAGQQFNFTLVDGRGYVTVEDAFTGALQHSACLDAANIPPLHSLKNALNHARVIDSVRNAARFNVTCNSGKLVEFMFANEPFVFCAPSVNEHTVANVNVNESADTIHGPDMSATLQIMDNDDMFGYIGAGSSVVLAPPSSFNLSQCASVDSVYEEETASSFAAIAATRAADAISVASRENRMGFFGSDDCECRDGMKACLFVHGLGEGLFSSVEGVTDTFPRYWGDLENTASCCSSVKFLRMDTMRNAWYDDLLPQQMCDAAISMTNSEDKMALEDIVITAHSMGNLVLAAAKLKGMCGIDTKTSKWIALAAPMAGSQAANLAMEFCKDRDSTFLDDPVVAALTALGICPMFASVASMPYYQSSASNPSIDSWYEKAMEVYDATVSSTLCGDNGFGLTSIFSAPLDIISKIVKHSSDDNDGVVEFTSCRSGRSASEFSSSWSSGRFYKAGINHQDASFRTGDGWWGDNRKPLKWFNCQF